MVMNRKGIDEVRKEVTLEVLAKKLNFIEAKLNLIMDNVASQEDSTKTLNQLWIEKGQDLQKKN